MRQFPIESKTAFGIRLLSILRAVYAWILGCHGHGQHLLNTFSVLPLTLSPAQYFSYFSMIPPLPMIFSNQLLISYKWDKNISNFLVNSTLKSHHQPGTFKCARIRCRTCPFISKFRELSELFLLPIISCAFPQSYLLYYLYQG